MCSMTNTTTPAPTVGGLGGGRGQLMTPGDNPALATSLTHGSDRAVTVCVRIPPAPDIGAAQWSGRPDPHKRRVLCPQCGGRIVPVDTARGGEPHRICPQCGAEDVWDGGTTTVDD